MAETVVVDLCSDDDGDKKPAAVNAASSDGSNDANSTIRLYWTGPPIAWSRPKAEVVVNKGTGRYKKNFHDPNAKDIARIRGILRSQLPAEPHPYYGRDVPLNIECEFYRRLPNSHFRSDVRDESHIKYLSTMVNAYDSSTPDVDNLVKFVMEAMQKTVYHDDVQVVMQSGVKMLDNEPPYDGRTIVRIRPLLVEDLPEPENPLLRPGVAVQSKRRLEVIDTNASTEESSNVI